MGFGPSLAVGGQQAAEGPGHGPNPAVIPWLNLDVPGMECRSRGGFSFQATLGLTMPLADFHYDVADTGDTVRARRDPAPGTSRLRVVVLADLTSVS